MTRWENAVSDLTTIDYFSAPSLIADAYGYYGAIRQEGPVWQEPHYGAFMVTGYDEVSAVYRDPEIFSSCNSVVGPFVDFPEEPDDPDDFSAIIETHRHSVAFGENFITFDPPQHTAHRSLLMRLLTPKRLEENEEFMWWASDSLIDRFASSGGCEFAGQYAQRFSLGVIADLLGVPEEDHWLLHQKVVEQGPAGKIGQRQQGNLLGFLEEFFIPYIEERRREPRSDVMTAMARARFPDGTLPEVIDVVRVATILFSGGQGTSARFQIAMLKLLAEEPDLQHRLRQNRSLIRNFIEEGLRFNSPTKVNFRMARVSTELGGVHIPAGSTIVLLLNAADRDERRFECPAEFHPDRLNAGVHLAFGRGRHSCPGGPLVRTEASVTLNRFLDRMDDIRISEAHHGPPGARRFKHTPSYIMQGVDALNLEFTSRSAAHPLQGVRNAEGHHGCLHRPD
jgi:cytochrome P450